MSNLNMKPTLIDKPYDTPVADIIKTFESGRPLSPDQVNFIARHEKMLSSYGLDSVMKYYLKKNRSEPLKTLSLMFPRQKINTDTLSHLKHSVKELLHQHLSHVDLKMTPQQYQQFKTVGIKELIFWHGNHYLTGAPFFPGGIPHVIYFQWGNLFGVVKMEEFAEENAMQGNVLVYFEEMNERHLYECVMDYAQHHKMELQPQLKPQLKPDIALSEEKKNEDVETQTLHIATPTLRPYFYEIGDHHDGGSKK